MLTGTQVLLLIASETGHVYTFSTPKLRPLISADNGRHPYTHTHTHAHTHPHIHTHTHTLPTIAKAMIQSCLISEDPVEDGSGGTSGGGGGGGGGSASTTHHVMVNPPSSQSHPPSSASMNRVN